MHRIVKCFCTLVFFAVTTQAQIQPSFFGMGIATTADMPKVSYGVISHPAVSWTAIEGTARGTYFWADIDNFVKKAPKDGNGAAAALDEADWPPPSPKNWFEARLPRLVRCRRSKSPF